MCTKYFFLIFEFLVHSKCFLGSFREAVGPFLVVGQFFGVMPVVGVKSHLIENVKFKWTTLRTAYSIAVATILAMASVFLIWQAFTRKLEFLSIC